MNHVFSAAYIQECVQCGKSAGLQQRRVECDGAVHATGREERQERMPVAGEYRRLRGVRTYSSKRERERGERVCVCVGKRPY
jgi:hypothetical protein